MAMVETNFAEEAKLKSRGHTASSGSRSDRKRKRDTAEGARPQVIGRSVLHAEGITVESVGRQRGLAPVVARWATLLETVLDGQRTVDRAWGVTQKLSLLQQDGTPMLGMSQDAS